MIAIIIVAIPLFSAGAGDRELGAYKDGSCSSFLLSFFSFFLFCFFLANFGVLIGSFTETYNHNFLRTHTRSKDPYDTAHAGTQKKRVPEEANIGALISSFTTT